VRDSQTSLRWTWAEKQMAVDVPGETLDYARGFARRPFG
jgi:hypothetical protein